MGALGELRHSRTVDRVASIADPLDLLAIMGLVILVAGAALAGFLIHRSGSSLVAIGGLAALETAVLSLVWLAFRRNRRLQRERLCRHEAQARDVERRRLIGELHDGEVEDLAGI